LVVAKLWPEDLPLMKSQTLQITRCAKKNSRNL